MIGQLLNPIELLLQLDWAEGDDLEFKSAKGGLPGSLWETYPDFDYSTSIFANIGCYRCLTA